MTTNLGPILVATDFSAPARHAVDRASRLAYETSSPLTVMHVLPGGALGELRKWFGTGHAIEHQVHDDAHRQVGLLIAELQSHQNIVARAVSASGAVIDEIAREADALDAGLVVTGARGSGLVRRLALGSTSDRLLRRTTRPLLVVRRKLHGPYRRVLVALGQR